MNAAHGKPFISLQPSDSFVVRGCVERGDQRGRTIGFPTANVAIEPATVTDGVWAGWVDCRDRRHVAAISVGNRPTFYGRFGFRLLEAHILDFADDIYGETITIWLGTRLREQVCFGSVTELVDQLARDVAHARAWAASCSGRALAAARTLSSISDGRVLAIV